MGEKYQKFNHSQLMTANDFEIYHYKHYKDINGEEFNVDLHHHDFYEIYFFISGDVTFSIESKQYVLLPGDVLLINPKELHQPKFGPGDAPYERIVLWVRKSCMEKFKTQQEDLTECFDSSDHKKSNLLRVGTQRQNNILKLLKLMIFENENQLYGSEFLKTCFFGQLLVEINRLMRETPHMYKPQDKGSALASEVVNYINTHYQEKISLEALAAKFFMSKYHLSHEFNRVVGTSIYRYIIQKRLLIAKQMLYEDMSPTDVYQKCGFGDYANFYRAFKSEYGISPKEFVSEIKKNNDR